MLHGPCAHGYEASSAIGSRKAPIEERSGGGCHPDPCHRHGGTRGNTGPARPQDGQEPHHPWGRQGPRHWAYDASPFVAELRARKVTPHIAVQGTVSKLGKVRKTAIDKRTLRHQGYVLSLRCRKRIEEVFGWIKAQAGYDRVKVRSKARVTATFTDPVAAYNLIRLPKLIAMTPT